MVIDRRDSSLGSVVYRHIKDGDFDPKTLWRGAKLAAKHLAVSTAETYSLEGPKIADDFLGHKGLTMVSYGMPFRYTRFSDYKIDVRFILFPESWKFNIGLTTNPLGPEVAMLYELGAVAAFQGPTFDSDIYSEPVANNGFMFQGRLLRPFMETKPAGKRRGAIIQYENGNVQLVNDTIKWAALSDPQGIKAISGTSDYFTNDETSEQLRQSERPKHQSSLLIQDKDTGRLVYYPTNFPLPREAVYRTVQEFAHDFGIGHFMAVELEHNGAAFYVREKHANTVYAYPGHIDYRRRDHYYFEE